MNVYRIKATNYWTGNGDTLATFYVIAPRVSEALDLWLQEKPSPVEDEPDSIVCLGKAILPAQGGKYVPPAQGLGSPGVVCRDCGSPPFLGCPQDCPSRSRIKSSETRETYEVRCLGCGALEGRPHHEDCGSIERRIG